ncbi:hypothetical protein B0J17DRAFT_121026 [Rhizoctonia solani]|nr:hypothetical protein B0J17DRAFT_121026 [Rhizoctonia solani]
MAHPRLFKGIDITDGSEKHSLVGGELGSSNPLARVLDEVRGLYPGRHVSCILSIGAGHPQSISIPEFGHAQSLGVAMLDMAVDSERVVDGMARRFQDTTGIYFRFNVDQGIQDVEMDDWKKDSKVAAHAQTYMSKHEVNQSIHEAVKTIYDRNAALAVECIDGRIRHALGRPSIKSCPVPTAYYTGRVKEIQRVVTCIADSDTEGQLVCVIHGLGGAGKSQLAFKAIQQTYTHWKHLIYVDATSRETIEGTLRDFAKAKRLGDSPRDTLQWLEEVPAP